MITEDEVKHIAGLARIGINNKEIEKYQKEMSAILDWMEQLKEVDITNVEPTAQITGLENITRADKTDDFENKSKIIDLFPEKKDRYDKVKSIF